MLTSPTVPLESTEPGALGEGAALPRTGFPSRGGTFPALLRDALTLSPSKIFVNVHIIMNVVVR